MMGFTNQLAWGLTTGFVDCYDVFVEQLAQNQYRTADGWQPIEQRTEVIGVKGGEQREVNIRSTQHGVLLEPLMQELGRVDKAPTDFQTSLYWSLRDVPTSAGALALLPTARSADEFGELLFENNVCPLVNNIICVDKANNLQRYIATTTPVRRGVTGSVPLAGWPCNFHPRATRRRRRDARRLPKPRTRPLRRRRRRNSRVASGRTSARF